MRYGSLGLPKGHRPARQIALSIVLSISTTLAAMVTAAPPAKSQIALGISLGTMVLSRMASSHSGHHSSSRCDNSKRRAIDAYNRGTKLLDKGEYREALDSFSEALAIDPNMSEAHWNSAVAFNKLEDYDHCLTESLAVIQERRHDSQALFMAAEACQHLHRLTEADQYYQQYLDLDKSGNNAEIAHRAVAIIENNFLGKPEGDYLADATKEGAVAWPSSKMPLKVFIQEDKTVAGYVPEFSTAVKDAFAEWANVSDGKISFIFTDKEADAQIVCAWTGDKLQLGSTKELGLTHTLRRDNEIISAKIDLYTLVDRPGLKLEELVAAAKEVDLHEIGHALGLEHSSQPYDTMYFETTPDGLEFALTPRDKKTILSLYSNSLPLASGSTHYGSHGSSISSINNPAINDQRSER